MPGKPDFVFFRRRVVVFVDGDFWHGRNWPHRKQRLASGSNSVYWVDKIGGNIRRDRKITRTLRAKGWKVVRVWESDILSKPERVALRVVKLLNSRSNVANL